jgi:hypothetical protein
MQRDGSGLCKNCKRMTRFLTVHRDHPISTGARGPRTQYPLQHWNLTNRAGLHLVIPPQEQQRYRRNGLKIAV